MTYVAGSWTNEAHVEELKRLHKEGYSASQIAAAICRKFSDASYTRNAVIGKLSRLGIRSDAQRTRLVHKRASPKRAPKRNPRAAAPKPAKLPKAPKAANPKLSVIGNIGVFEQSDAPPVLPPVNIRAWAPLPGSAPLTLEALTRTSCRWPIDLPHTSEAHFCGRMAEDGPYCPTHAALSRPAGNAKDYLDKRLGIAVAKAA